MSPSATAPLIKGYLPVRLRLPDNEETFIYVKEHIQQQGNNDNHDTIFVSNCPTVSTVRTKLILTSIFGRYGDVTRVTVVPNPRRKEDLDAQLQNWTTNFCVPTYRYQASSDAGAEGKFAHVVFSSAKEMKRTFKALQDAMTMSSSDDTTPPALQLDKIEIQTLADETDRLVHEEQGEEQDDDDDNNNDEKPTSSGILAVADRYRASCQRLLSRDKLLQECNTVMQAFEDAEADHRRECDEAVPDDDGFVTVSHSAATGSSKRDLESTDQRGRNSNAGQNKRSRKKKNMGGEAPLTDFYRFQTREHRKKSLHELRQRFEEDLVRVKKMKEERHYRPF